MSSRKRAISPSAHDKRDATSRRQDGSAHQHRREWEEYRDERRKDTHPPGRHGGELDSGRAVRAPHDSHRSEHHSSNHHARHRSHGDRDSRNGSRHSHRDAMPDSGYRDYPRHHEQDRHRSLQQEGRLPRGPRQEQDSLVGGLEASEVLEEGQVSPAQIKLVQPVRDTAIDFELEPSEEEEARMIEERRRKRAAILAKHAGAESSTSTATSATRNLRGISISGQESPAVLDTHPSDSPIGDQEKDADFALAKADTQGAADDGHIGGPQVSAADYNPDSDRLEDEARARAKLQTSTGANGASQPVEGEPSLAAGIGEAQERVEGAESEYEEIEVDDDDEVEDMFALGSDDESSKPKKKIIRVKKGAIASQAPVIVTAPEVSANLLDNFDDADGYYKINLGERIGPEGRYLVFANLGRGMFSNVVKARETIPSTSTEPAREREVAIKVVRSQETMYKAGIKEMAILQKLASLDPEDKRHVIRLDSHFEHRGHLCMVFELLSMNLREVVKRFGKDVGLNYRAVRAYAHQMFLALSLLRKANVIHADIKPDNILVNEGKNVLKLCDLGSASDATEVEITPYLVSRFYRAPEIVLGAPYDCAIDVWSIGCTLYEVATGKILFPGRTNNQMLLLMQELRGRFTTKQAKKGRFAAQHFDDTNNFLSMEKDKNTGVDVIRKVNLQKPVEDLRARLLPANTAKKLSDEELRLTNNFIDLLNRTLELDPAKRITPREALNHPFLS